MMKFLIILTIDLCVSKSDKEVNRIKKILMNSRLLQGFNDYIWYLAQKYNHNTGEEELDTKGCSITLAGFTYQFCQSMNKHYRQ